MYSMSPKLGPVAALVLALCSLGLTMACEADGWTAAGIAATDLALGSFSAAMPMR